MRTGLISAINGSSSNGYYGMASCLAGTCAVLANGGHLPACGESAASEACPEGAHCPPYWALSPSVIQCQEVDFSPVLGCQSVSYPSPVRELNGHPTPCFVRPRQLPHDDCFSPVSAPFVPGSPRSRLPTMHAISAVRGRYLRRAPRLSFCTGDVCDVDGLTLGASPGLRLRTPGAPTAPSPAPRHRAPPPQSLAI